MSSLTELMQSRSVEVESFSLDIRSISSVFMWSFVGMESESLMDLEDLLDCTLDEPRTIRILYTNNILSMIFPSPEE
jgi:hypothetical protein